MDNTRLDFKWLYDTRDWQFMLSLGTGRYILSSLQELSDYITLPASDYLDGMVYMQSETGLGDLFDVQLNAKTVFEEQEGTWKVTALYTGLESLGFHSVLSILLRLSGQGFPISLLPEGAVKIVDGSYVEETEAEPDKLESYVLTEMNWKLFGNLSIGELGVAVCTRGEYGQFRLLGSVLIGDSRLSLQVSYDAGCFAVGADRRRLPMPLPSLTDLGGLFGLDICGLLPEEIASLGKPQIENLLFLMAADFKSLDKLEFSVALGEDFSFLGIQSLTLSELGIDFNGYGIGAVHSNIFLQIRGCLSFEQQRLELSALKYGEKDSWCFSGTLYNGNRWGFMSLWDFLEIGEAPNILRKLLVPVTMLTASYDMGKKHFSIKAQFENKNEIFMDAQFTNAQFMNTQSTNAQSKNSGMKYTAGLSLASEIRLSSLPVVGESLHLFDAVCLNNISLVYQTDTGLKLTGGLRLFGEAIPFALWIVQNSKALKSEGTEGDGVCFLKVNLKLGPLELARIGIGCGEKSITFRVDVSVTCSGLHIQCRGLGITLDIADFTKIGFMLRGLELAIVTSAFSLGGSFYQNGTKPLAYDGSLLLKAGDFTLTAIGSYTEVETHPSIFAYGVLNKAIGGPPAFYIKGIAAGFGYQRELILPDIDNVESFPLICMVLNPGSEAGYIIELKEKYVKEAVDQMWLAAGIHFTSFEMIDSFALLTVSCGRKVEIALLGLGRMKLQKLAYAALALRVVLCPQDGIFSMMEMLTKDSYIFSEDCRLTGGFAFNVWYGGPHKGDFVLSIGGYHEDFKKPEHYPRPDRLGFAWKVNRNLNFSGSLYFALTPSCIMAGGGMDARYENGGLKAWFYARADFIMYWKPFHYAASMVAGVGVSYRVDALFVHHTFKMELAVSLRLWGPEFAGWMKVSLWIVSFTISFGSGTGQLQYLDWDTFLAECILGGESDRVLDGSDAKDANGVFAAITVVDGLLGEDVDSSGKKVCLVRGEGLALAIQTKLPNDVVEVNHQKTLKQSGEKSYVLPMGGKELSCSCHVTVEKCISLSQDIWKPVKEDTFLAAEQFEDLPKALWGKELSADAGMVEHALTGVRLTPAPVPCYLFPEAPVDLDRMAYEEAVEKDVQLYTCVYHIVEEEGKQNANHEFAHLAGDAEIVRKREELFGWFGRMEMGLTGDGRIEKLAERVDELFTEQMTFCRDQCEK